MRDFMESLYKMNPSKMAAVHVLDMVIAANKVLLPLPIISAIAEAGEEGIFGSVAGAAGMSLLGLAMNVVLPRVRDYIVGEVRHNTQKEITLNMVDSVYKRELDTMLGAPTGSCALITSKNYGSVGLIAPTLYSDILPIFTETFGLSAALTYYYGLVGVAPVLILAAYSVSAFLRESMSSKLKEENSLLMRESFMVLMGAINNYQIAHQYGNTKFELDKLNKALSKMESSYNQVQKEGEKNSLLLSSLSQVSIVAVILYTLMRNPSGVLKMKDLLPFIYYVFRFSSLLDSLPSKINTLYMGLLDTRLISNFFDTKSSIAEPVNSKYLGMKSAPRITFENVSFSYGENKPSLSNISFTVEPKQKVAIMGSTGSGKSTLLKLLQRFYNFSGKISLDGNDITAISTEDLRSSISVVSQETGLMEGTILSNINYGDLKAQEGDILSAAKHAGLKFERARFFGSVQQQGSNFSGGEKQRIAIARALLKKGAHIFLLDEPTSALDHETSREVLKTLDQLTGFATTLIVTHDPNVAVNADRIVYFEHGKIVETGTYKELMDLKGSFYKQVLVQCDKLGVSVEDIKPLNKREEDETVEYLEWRNSRV